MKFVFIVLAVALQAQTPHIDFTTQVEPIFKAKCYGCHGASRQTSGLRLDNGPDALRGGYTGVVIVPGDPAHSPLFNRISGSGVLKPMPFGSKGLGAAQVGTIRAWIEQGAKFPESASKQEARTVSKHWSFQPVPDVVPGENRIDEFIRGKLAKEGITPSDEASKTTLLRRVSLDLIGLPPTPAEIDAFLSDKSERAYERQVDRLLASNHFGERWARPWLDQARYADSDGYEKDWVRPFAWRWREWVINAINADMPFDEFTIEQIAGDLLPNATVAQRVATGFHRNTLTNREGGVDNQQFRFEAVADRAATVASVWLGLTVGCAQCHDHKYDPIRQKDFYQMYAFFDNADPEDIDAPLPGERARWQHTAAEYEKERGALIAAYGVAELQPEWERNMLDAAAHPGKHTDWDLAWDCLLKLTEGGDGERIIHKRAAERTARESRVLQIHFIRNYHFAVGQPKYKELKFDELDRKLKELDAKYPPLTEAYVLSENPKPHPSFLRVRGDYKAMGVEVQPDAPLVLPEMPKHGRGTRLDLARWLVRRDNPLTARVAVNRLWQELFGQGIVKTSEDFGVMGARPTHPELLDWLAADFMQNGWSRKQILRKMVLSATYRQSSVVRKEILEKDPENRLLARQSRLRLPAESIRDAALRASGLLNEEIGGPSIHPPQPAGVTAIGYAGGTKWTVSPGAEQYRRGLYIHFQRTTPYPLLANFDAPRSTVSACSRLRSNTPLQALNLLNDPVFLGAAETMAGRSAREGGADRLGYLFELALQRPPNEAERRRMQKFLDGGSWTNLASVLLNLDEFVTRE